MEKGSSEGEVGEEMLLVLVVLLLMVVLFKLLLLLFELLVVEWEPERFNRVDVVEETGKVICG